MSEIYRPELPPVPKRMRRLPVRRGYPVPWFVEMVDGDFDFRVQSYAKRIIAVQEKRCWLCGDVLGSYLAFVIGPMCAINRVSGEPPSHRECAEFAAKGCPFLTQQEKDYRAAGIPKDAVMHEAAIVRQPGVALIWITKSYQLIPQPNHDYLVRIGDAVETLWYREGRSATRAEVMDSFDSGCPILRNMAEQEGPKALALYERMKIDALRLIPAAA